MGTALGIYVEKNLIKYSKVFSNRNKYYIEAYGVKYTNKVSEGIEQIVRETNSEKIPIVVNAVDQDYSYFDIFSKLNERDYEKSIDLQFEELASESSINKNLLQTGYTISKNPVDSERLHVIHASQYLTAMDTRANLFKTNKPSAQMPIGISVTNLVKDKGSYIILNLEEKTELTSTIDGEVFEVKQLQHNTGAIINQINHIENSIPKSYEVLKNTIVPISESDNLNMEENTYIPVILMELNEIINEVKSYIKDSPLNIKKIYLTGTGASVSNIELLFSESILGLDVEILKPFFLDTTSLNLSIKEYVDVNSASALALEELGFDSKTMSFKSNYAKKASINLNMDLKDIDFSQLGDNIKDSFVQEIQPFESFAIRFSLTSIIILILFISISIMLTKSNSEKLIETQKLFIESQQAVGRINTDIGKVKAKIEEYNALLSKMDEGSSGNKNNASYIRKDALPNFLNQVAHHIPVRVKVTDIKEEGSHVTMTIESEKYEQLGFFVGLLETNGVLMKIKTSTSQKAGNLVTLVVEGDLP